MTGMHQVGLFINGFDDLKTALRFFTPFESSQILLGKYKTQETFNGTINNMTVFFYPATDEEIKNMRQQA